MKDEGAPDTDGTMEMMMMMMMGEEEYEMIYPI